MSAACADTKRPFERKRLCRVTYTTAEEAAVRPLGA
jgi:hypothetical protein